MRFARARLQGVLDPNGPAAAATHDATNRCLVGGLLGRSHEDIMTARQANEEIWAVTADGVATLT